MGTYLLRRLLFMIPTLVGITLLVFLLVVGAGGGVSATVTANMGGGNLQASSGVAVQQAYLEDRYGLRDPLLVQYLRWLGRISPIKFGTRDQVLPSGEMIRAPKAVREPPVWSWFAEALPPPPASVESPFKPDMPEEDRVRLWRRAERAFAEARFSLLEHSTRLEGALVSYARAVGLDQSLGAVTGDGKLRPERLAGHNPDRAHPDFKVAAELGVSSIKAYGDALAARAELDALFRSRPFPQSGIGLVPGVLSLAPPDFGTAFSRGRPSIDLIGEHLWVTLLLNAVAIPIIYFVAIPGGILAATRRGSLVDAIQGFTVIGLYSFPVVLGGILAIGFLASKDSLHAFPVAGLNSSDAAAMAFLPGYDAAGEFRRGWLLDRIWHMCLPVMCMVYTGFAVLSKQTRAAMLENFNADYVRTAKAKGVAPRDVLFRHVFRNSLLPLITIFVTIFPAMLAGSVIVERIFSVRGMGWLVIEAITLRDRELILANTVIVAGVNLLALLLADILYALADPRIAYD